MKPEQRQSRIARIIVGAALLLGGGGALTLLILPPRLTLAFYDVEPALVSSMEKTINLWAKEARVSVRYRDKPVSGLDDKSLRGVDMLFLYPSAANGRHSGSFSTLSPELVEPLSLPLRRSVEADGRAWALPVAADTMELAWRKDLFGQGAKPSGLRLSDLGGLARGIKGKALTPLVTSGGDDRILVDLAGLLVIERGGLGPYLELAKLTDRGDGRVAALLDRGLGGGCSLRSSLECLADWKREGSLHQNWLEFKDKDLVSFIEGGISGLAIESLAQHRRVAYEAISAWDSSVIMARPSEGLPVATAGLVSIARPRTARGAKSFGRLASYLISQEGQRSLESSTRLAPVSSGVSAADAQASAARSAVNGAMVVQGLARDGFSSDASRSEFAEDLRLYLMSPANEK
jgi:hypothetical protein